VDVAIDGLVVVDEHGTVVYCNEGAAELLGVTLPNFIGAQFPYPYCLTADDSEIEQCGPGVRVLQARARPLAWDGGDGRVISIHDVTRYRVAATSLETAVADQRLAVAAAVHELRSPLAAIAITAESLKGSLRAEDRPTRQAMLDRIIAESKLLATLLRELQLSFRTAIDASPHRAVDLATLLTSGFATRPQWIRGLELACPAALSVRGDAARTWAIVSTCVDNAFRHGAPPVRVTCRQRGDRTEITVSDSGSGPAPELVPYLFEPLTSGRRSPSPLEDGGMGLAIARALARRAGGDCWYAPRPGEPSRFMISLPTGLPPDRQEE